MKKSTKFLTVLLVISLAIIVGCEQEDHILPEKDWFVAFEAQNATIAKTSPNNLRVPVYVAAGAGTAISVKVGIRSENTTAQPGIDYEFIHGPVLNYPIGAGYDTLVIKPLSPGNAGQQRLWLFLESNSANYNMGFSHGANADSTSFADFVIIFQ